MSLIPQFVQVFFGFFLVPFQPLRITLLYKSGLHFLNILPRQTFSYNNILFNQVCTKILIQHYTLIHYISNSYTTYGSDHAMLNLTSSATVDSQVQEHYKRNCLTHYLYTFPLSVSKKLCWNVKILLSLQKFHILPILGLTATVTTPNKLRISPRHQDLSSVFQGYL